MTAATDASAQQRAASSWTPTTADPGYDSQGNYFRTNSGQKVYTSWNDSSGTTQGTDVIANGDDDAGKARYTALDNPNSADSQAFTMADSASRQAAYASAANAANNRAAPVTNYSAANVDATQGNLDRGIQTQAANSYLGTINGTTPSVAQAQFAQALNASRASNSSMAASARGGGLARAAAQDTAIQSNSQMDQQNAAASGALRAQEIATAQQGLSGISTSMRSGDTSQQGQDASQAQYASTLGLQNRSANDAQNQFYTNQGANLDTTNLQAQIAKQGEMDQAISADQQQQNINNGQAAASSQRTSQTVGQVAATTGAVLAAAVSDRREKTDIRSADHKMQSFLDAMGKAKEYQYRHPGAPGQAPGRHVGPMAQELERSEVGKRLVSQGPNGTKQVAFGSPHAVASAFAALASMNERLKKVEASKGRK